MNYEELIAQHIVSAKYEDLKPKDVTAVKKQLLALYGATIAGWDSMGCQAVYDIAKELGGKEEATVLVRGGKFPGQQAAFVNAVMGRALDICDHIAPGVHIGSAVIPAAMAAAEMAGGCSGKDLILAVAVGTDLALRLNLSDDDFDGFDPTGVDAMFASAAAAAKLLKLDEKQTLNALALAFNRCGGSFQSNIDGSLAVRVIEGWVAQNGVECARLAKAGVTGPKNWLQGVYGYAHIFGRDHMDFSKLTNGLGKDWLMDTISFKKYPSCGQTQGSTELILKLMKEGGFEADDIDVIEEIINPFTYKLVGKKFELGDNPKVDAQFNVGYCVANAAVRHPVILKHFEPEFIKNDEVLNFLQDHVKIIVKDELHERGHYSSDMVVRLKDGREYKASIDVPPGSVGNELAPEDFKSRFYDCIDFSEREEFKAKADGIFEQINAFENIGSLSDFIALINN